MIKVFLKKITSENSRAQIRRLEQLVRLPLYYGKKVECPCCDKFYRVFLNFYGKEKIRCPYCNSLERQRFQVNLLTSTNYIDFKTDNILHIAPEFSLNLWLKQFSNSNYTTMDSLQSFIPGICVKPEIVGDLRSAPFENKKFKLVICNHVLEHIVEDDKALSEISRITCDDGIVLITVPIRKDGNETLESKDINTDELRMLHYGATSHYRFYGLDIIKKFQNNGFFVKVAYPKDYLSLHDLKLRCIEADEPHFILTKADIVSAL